MKTVANKQESNLNKKSLASLTWKELANYFDT